MLPLVISIISIFVVVGVSTTIYVQAAQQRDLYNKRLSEVVGKTNSANQYEFEKNKDQEVSLDRVRGDVVKFDTEIAGLNKHIQNVQAEYGGKIYDISANMNNVNQQVSKTLDSIQNVSQKQTDSIANFKETLGKTTGEVRILNDQMAIVNGKLVNVGEKQQVAIDGLVKDATSLKTQQSDLRDYVYNLQSQTTSSIKSQNETIAGYHASTTDRLVKQDEQISKAFNVAKSVQNIVTTLDTAIENVRAKFNDYVSKTDILGYATKGDLDTINNTFGNYVHSSDFTAFKNSLPAMYTAQEMDALKQSFITEDDIALFRNTLNSLDVLTKEIKSVTDSLDYTYAKKTELLGITGGTNQETITLGSLQILLNQLDAGLQQVKQDVASVTTSFNSFKPNVETNYALKSFVNSEVSRLQTSIDALKNTAEMTLGVLTVNTRFTANGDVNLNGVAISKTFTGFPDSDNSRSEIVNDSTAEKKLLLVGNKSAGTSKREVGVWDNLTVSGNVTASTGKIAAKDLDASGSLMIGANGDKGYFKSDGTGFVSGDFGVGAKSDDPLFGAGKKQMVVKGTKPNDWQVLLNNTNGNRNIWMNHGGGSGMEISTNDGQANNYAIRTKNNTGSTFEVMNDGNTNVYGNLTVSGTGKKITGDGSGITNINAGNVATGILGVGVGGTGANTLAAGKVLVGNGTTAITQPAELHWDSTNKRLGIGTSTPTSTLQVNGNTDVNGKLNVYSGTRSGATNNHMAPGSLTIGNIDTNFGGGTNWNANTAGLLMETADNTEIVVHDSYTRLASAMYYEGGQNNTITIGRDMGWGPTDVKIARNLTAGGTIGAGDTLCIKDICVTYEDLKRLKFMGDSKIFGTPLYLWEAYDPITASTSILAQNRMFLVECTRTPNYTHESSIWADNRYMMEFLFPSKTNGKPTNTTGYLRIKVPVDTTTHNSLFVLTITDGNWRPINASMMDSAGTTVLSKLQTRTPRKFAGSYATSFLGPTNESAISGSHMEWVQIAIPKDFITSNLIAGTNEIYVALNPGNECVNNYMYVAGIASCPNPYGICTLPAVDIWWTNNGGSALGMGWGDGANPNNEVWQGNHLVRMLKDNNIIDIRVPIVDKNKDLILGLIEHNSNWYGTAPRVFIPKYNPPSTNPPFRGFWKPTTTPIGRFANSIIGRSIYQYPLTIVIPKDAVQAGTNLSDNPNGGYLLQIRIDMRNTNENMYLRGIYTELLDRA